MWKNLLVQLKVKRAAKKTMQALKKRLCNPSKPFYSTDLHTLYEYLKKQEAPLLVSPQINGTSIEVSFDENEVDWFSFRIKYSVPNMSMTMKIAVRAGAPQVMSEESDTIFLTVESIVDNNKRAAIRKIIQRDFEFINNISFQSLTSDIRTPTTEKILDTIKRVLANAFEIIIDYLIKWV